MARLAIATGSANKHKKPQKPKGGGMALAPQFAEDDLIAKKVKRAREELMAANAGKPGHDTAEGDASSPPAAAPSAQMPVARSEHGQRVVDRRVEDSVNALRDVMKIPNDVEITYEFLLSELLGLAVTHLNLVRAHRELLETVRRIEEGPTGTCQSGLRCWN